MRALHVSKKTGFKVTDPAAPVNIRDDRGILFYTTEPILPVYEFNLPEGDYFVDSGSFKEMSNPISFKLATLPKSERLFSIPPYGFKVLFEDNPNKCTIFWKEGCIVFDKSFAERPLPQLYFIYFHELGHSRYGYGKLYTKDESEAYCDLYASNQMLKMGFNPSQIIAAPRESLSCKQDFRKDFIEQTLIDNAYK